MAIEKIQSLSKIQYQPSCLKSQIKHFLATHSTSYKSRHDCIKIKTVLTTKNKVQMNQTLFYHQIFLKTIITRFD